MCSYVLTTKNACLGFDQRTLQLTSFTAHHAPDVEFIAPSCRLPVFEIGIIDANHRYVTLESKDASNIQTECSERHVLARYRRINGLDLDVTISAHADRSDDFVRFSITVDNRCSCSIVDVRYPMIVCRYELDGTVDTESVILPHGYGSGRRIRAPLRYDRAAHRHRFAADDWAVWEFSDTQDSCNHYPGMQFAQFLALHNDRAGLFLMCNDTKGGLKRFLPLHREPGLRLGLSHVGDWPQNGRRTLEYDILLRAFCGDWMDAANIYRNWSRTQKWFVPLFKRQLPKWLTDSPVYVTVRPAGILDYGYEKTEAFLPLTEKTLPLLEKLQRETKSDPVVVLMGWEKQGSWVGPDSFPPVGGEDEMKRFIDALRARGMHAGTFSNGARFVWRQCWSRYDGRDYLDQIDAMQGVAKAADGTPRTEHWPNFRSAYLACIGSKKGSDMIVNFVNRLFDWGMQSIQFFDQNNGGAVFACFSKEHDHPPMPGLWMNKALRTLMDRIDQAQQKQALVDVVHSAESGLNETALDRFDQTELRLHPNGYGADSIPLYQYLFHECIAIQGMMGHAPEPYHNVIKNATNCVLGGMPGGVMTGDGSLLDKDTNNWALWEPKTENQDHALDMIRRTAALRRGIGRDFLLYGRMQRPSCAQGIQTVRWSNNGRCHAVKAVFLQTWQTPHGRWGTVLANWTDQEQSFRLQDSRFLTDADRIMLTVPDGHIGCQFISKDEGFRIVMPAHRIALIHEKEQKNE